VGRPLLHSSISGTLVLRGGPFSKAAPLRGETPYLSRAVFSSAGSSPSSEMLEEEDKLTETYGDGYPRRGFQVESCRAREDKV
jgi:hypothetical protein